MGRRARDGIPRRASLGVGWGPGQRRRTGHGSRHGVWSRLPEERSWALDCAFGHHQAERPRGMWIVSDQTIRIHGRQTWRSIVAPIVVIVHAAAIIVVVIVPK